MDAVLTHIGQLCLLLLPYIPLRLFTDPCPLPRAQQRTGSPLDLRRRSNSRAVGRIKQVALCRLLLRHVRRLLDFLQHAHLPSLRHRRMCECTHQVRIHLLPFTSPAAAALLPHASSTRCLLGYIG